MKESIRKRALALSFDACHFTSASRPDHADVFDRWLAQNRHGEMAWLERNAHKRTDPRQVLAGAKSIITLAVSYHGSEESDARSQTPESGNQEAIGRRGKNGIVARYARYADYHDVLKAPLIELAQFVDSLSSAETRSLWYVDTGPLLERDLAQRSGLGFVGKHTNLISRSLGTWFFLAEIITTLELEPDAPEKNRCGSCTRCLAACPTEAITAPFELDARKCISYLTIELKGSIPEEFRPAIGNRVYGCDDCLAVCPWNRFAKVGRLMKSHSRADLEQPDLIELLSLDDAGFKHRFAGTPMLRTKRRGILRNVCVALGNIGDESALPHLERATHDHEPLIREHAAWAIRQITLRHG
ncbi:tRNA epoxyqueuosine(34) reductase QueG [bacterium]|nr:tRNA epoxyqueuosine(34) reductase QueG [bacterium]